MNVLVLGTGGREHALAWKIAQSEKADRVYVVPGNKGMTRTNKISIEGKIDSDSQSIGSFCRDFNIGLVVIGPEGLLVKNLAEDLRSQGIPTIGPNVDGARLEGSKIYCKEVLKKSGVVTADYKIAESIGDANKFIDQFADEEKIVIKVDGLAAGKGVVVAKGKTEAKIAAEQFMIDPEVEIKSDQILIEKCLEGVELSAFALCRGKDFKVLGYAQDYKRVGEGDTGPNTGGMGVWARSDRPTSQLKTKISEKVFAPVLNYLDEKGTPFEGILFAGLMIDKNNDPQVIEFNVRFGDPEAQALMPLIESDLLEYFLAQTEGKLAQLPDISFKNMDSIHVVLASGNYPSIGKEKIKTGREIFLGKSFEHLSSAEIFFAGVEGDEGGKLVNSGGRILGVTCWNTVATRAKENVYRLINDIQCEESHFRRDIGPI